MRISFYQFKCHHSLNTLQCWSLPKNHLLYSSSCLSMNTWNLYHQFCKSGVIILYVLFNSTFRSLLIWLLCFFCIYKNCRKKREKPRQNRLKTYSSHNQDLKQFVINRWFWRLLSCSEKHVFHDKFIIMWTALKPMCYIC